jgi:16S rRNA G527 N7-methylase RsmG
MPYIITTTTASARSIDSQRDVGYIVTRRAVATLEKAREAVASSVRANNPYAFAKIVAAKNAVTESGGTITLPDGTVIEVAPTTWHDILAALPPHVARQVAGNDTATIDAWNAAQENAR